MQIPKEHTPNLIKTVPRKALSVDNAGVLLFSSWMVLCRFVSRSHGLNTLSVKVSQFAFDRAASWEFRAETGQLGGLL